MTIATLSSKSQITLPAAMRKAIGLQPHDRVAIEASGKHILIRKAPDFFALKGCLGRALPREKEKTAMMMMAAGRRAGERA